MDNPDKIGDVTVALYACDVDESRDFFLRVLDFDVELDSLLPAGSGVQPLRRTRLRLKSNPTVAIELLQAEPGVPPATQPAGRGVPMVTIEVADCSAIAARQARFASGASVIVDRGETPYADFLTLTDPFGNVLQVMASRTG